MEVVASFELAASLMMTINMEVIVSTDIAATAHLSMSTVLCLVAGIALLGSHGEYS